MSEVQIQAVRWWHEQIVDYMLMCPNWTQGDLARRFHKTESWLSTVINSDAFREYKALRFAEHQSAVTKDVLAQAEDLASLGLDVMTERIRRERDAISSRTVLESAELALKACGYMGRAGPSVQVNNYTRNSVNVADAETLARARANMQRLRDAQIVDVTEVLPAPT